MTPESARFLEKSEGQLKQAEIMLTVALYDAAGRAAYLGGFHAAQALIFERIGRVFKTHRGVHGEFSKLIKDGPGGDLGLARFLSQAYELKSMADYELGPDAEVSAEVASATIAQARQFIARVTELIDAE